MIDVNRWFSGLTNGEPEEEESAVSKTLRMLQGGATDLYNRAAAPQTGVGEAVRGAASQAYGALPALPSFGAPPPGTPEALEHEEVLRRRGQVSSAIQTAAPVIQRGATGLYDAAQDSSNAVETVKRAGQAGWEAGSQTYVDSMMPSTLPEAAMAVTNPLYHLSRFGQAATDAAAGEIGRGLGRAAGTSTDPLFSVPGYGPISSEDIAAGVAQGVLDPSNLIGAGEAKAVGRVAGPAIARGAAGLADDFGRRAAGVADAVTGASLTPAARAAQAARLPDDLGAGFIPSHANDMRTRIIPPDVADTLDFPVRVPEDPFVLRAIQEAGGTVDERGTTLNVIRNQGPEAHGGVATRGAPFYIAGPPGAPNPYARLASSVADVGGPVRIEGPTRFRNPLIISGAPGEADGFDDAMRQLGRLTHENDNWRGLPVANAGTSASEVERGIAAAKRAGPAGSPERAQALKDLVARHGGDPDLIEPLMALRGADMGESVYAVKENIVAHNARRAGHDGVVTVLKQNAPYEQIAEHPEMVALQQRMDANDAKLRQLDAAHRPGQPYDTEQWKAIAADTQRAIREQAEVERRLRQELATGRVSELMDPREARNPTPGEPNPMIADAKQRLAEAKRAKADALAARRDAAELGDLEAERLALNEVSRWQDVQARATNDLVGAMKAPTATPPGYTLREDIPRRAGRLPEGFTVEPLDDGSGRWIIENDAGDQFHERTFATAAEARAYGVAHAEDAGARPAPGRLGAGVQSLLPGPGLRGQLQADAYNAAQGGVFGAASESLEAGAEDRETDFGEQLRRGGIGAGLATLAGRGVGRRGLSRAGARAADLGSGVVPRPRQAGIPGMGEELMPEMARPPRASGSTATDIPSKTMEEALPDIIRSLGAPSSRTTQSVKQRGPASLPLEAPDRGALARLRDGVSNAVTGATQKVGILRYAGMLADSASQVANIVPSAIMQGVDVAAGPIAAALDVGRVGAMKAAGKQADRQVFFGETPERLKGMRAGAGIGLQAARDALRSGLSAGEAAKLEQRAGFGTNIPGVAPAGSRAAGAIDMVAELPLRALGAADAAFRTTSQGGHLMAEAYAAAKRANGGKTPSSEQVRQAAKQPEVLDRVEYLSRRSVLQEDRLLTDWYKKGMDYRSDDPFTNAVAQTVKAGLAVEIPFVRTPYNVVAQGMGMSPAGLLGVIQDVKQGKAAREVELRLGRVALGTAVMGAAAADYAAGNLTGPYPETEKERSLLPPGWRPWSRKFEVMGETYYLPLSYLGPLALPPVMAILSGEAYKKGGWSLETAGEVAAGVGQYAAQETFIEGFGEVAKLFDSRTSPATWQRHAEQLAAQFSPHIIGGGALGREIQRVMGMPARDPEGPLEAIQATLPYAAEGVRPRQDVMGREESMGLGGPLGTLVRAGVENDHPVISAYRRADIGLPLRGPDTLTDPATKDTFTLDADQKASWERAFGQAIQQRWDETGNADDPKALERVKSKASEDARRAVLGG